MKKVNISVPEELFAAKAEYDASEGKRTSVQEFVAETGIGNKVYVDGGAVFPFAMIGDTLFTAADGCGSLEDSLGQIEYDLSKLRRISGEELLSKFDELRTGKYFIIDGEYWTLP